MGFVDYISFVIPFFVIIMVLVVIMTAFLSKGKRTKRLKEFALAYGFEFDEKATILKKLPSISPTEIKISDEIHNSNTEQQHKKNFFSFLKTEKFPLTDTGLEIFQSGDTRGAENAILVLYNQTKLIFMDYHYTVSSGDSSSTYKYTIALLKSNNIFPNFYLIPENFFHKIIAFVGFEDIDIPGYDEFSKIYYLKGKDKMQILAFFNPERIMFFQQNPGWHIHAGGNYFVAYKRTGYIKPNDYLTFIEETKNLISQLKIT